MLAVSGAAAVYACAEPSAPTAHPRDAGQAADTTSEASPDARIEQRDATSRDAEPDAAATCVHPAVVANCARGWCEIPAGCFWMGSPETEFGRGAATEPLVPTTLTHAFLIQQYETTQGEWKAMGYRNPTGDVPSPDFVACKTDDCAVGSITYFEGLAYANAKSEKEGYPTCYDLIGCTGTIGNGMTCTSFKVKDANSYECLGYRFPMGAEWEYAARAGTRTAFYSGDITVQPDIGSCYPEPVLDDIAWWCHNGGGTTHPVGQKKPNNWGLYDVLGNSAEFVIDHQRYSGYGTSAQLDPGNPVVIQEARGSRGLFVVGWASIMRAASWVGTYGWNDRSDGFMPRLVRTLPRPKADAGPSTQPQTNAQHASRVHHT